MPVLLTLRPASNTINFSVNTVAQTTKKHYSNARLLFFEESNRKHYGKEKKKIPHLDFPLLKTKHTSGQI